MYDPLKDSDPLMRDLVDPVYFMPKKYVNKDPEQPDPPRISVSKIQKSAGKLVEALAGHIGNTLKGTLWFDFIEDVCRVLEYPLDRKKTVLDSLQEYQGVDLNQRMLWRICFRLDANKDIIYDDMPIPVWRPEKDAVWVPVHVVDAEKVEMKEGKPLMRIHVLILAGRPAGSLIIQQMPIKYVRYFLKQVGLPKYDDVSEWEVFNTMFTALIAKTNAKSTAMTKFHVNSAQSKHNKELHKNRKDCPKHMPWFCDRCPLGMDKCRFAVKRHSWKAMQCVNGHNGYFKKRKDGTYGDRCIKCVFLDKKKGV